jgi:glycerol kinase
MNRGTTKAHVVRAAEESIAYQIRDVIEVMTEEAAVELDELTADGGATKDELLMQFQADILGIPIRRADVEEASALGSAYAAGLAVGVWSDLEELAQLRSPGKLFTPRMSESERDRLYAGWKEAVGRTLWRP